MKEAFYKLFRIYEGEGSKIFSFALVGILLQTGLAIGYVAADALFLTNAGADRLSYIYFILPGIMILVTPVVTYLTEKLGVDRFQIVTSVILAIGGIGVSFLAVMAEASDGTSLGYYYAIKLYASLWYITGFTVYWNFVDAYFDILSAKRLFPVLSGATAIGATFGGYLVTVFMDYKLNVAALFVVWGAFSLLAIFPTIKISRSFPRFRGRDDDDSLKFSDRLRNLSSAFRKSRYVFFLTLVTFIAMFINNVCEFQYMQVFEEGFNNEAALANLFGTLFMIVNVFNVFVTFFIFNRLISTLGIRNTALIQPIAYFISFILYLILYGQPEPMFYAAIIGFFVMQGFQVAIDDNNWNFMLNPIHQNVKSSVRTITEGIVDPLGGALAGLALIVLNQHLNLSHLYVSTFGVGLAVFFLIALMCVRHYYVDTMIQNLRSEWLDFSSSLSGIHSEIDENQKTFLIQKAQESNVEEAVTACRILWVIDRFLATELILNLLERHSTHHRQRVISVLSEALSVSDNKITRVILKWLSEHDRAISSSTIQALGQYHLIHDEFVMNMLESNDPQAHSAATTVLWNSWNVEKNYQAKWIVLNLLNGGDVERIAGIQSIGSSGHSFCANYLVPYLKEPCQEVRKAAKLALCQLVDENSSLLLPTIISIIRDGDEEIRKVGFQALDRIGDSNCIPSLLSIADSFSHFEQRCINQLIIGIGLRSIPATVNVVLDDRYPYFGRSIAARAIARLAFPQLQALIPKLIQQEIFRAYQILYFHSVLEKASVDSSGVRVLSRFYRDEQFSTIEFVLKILALGGQIPSHEMIASSLRSASPKTRGDAIETLEHSIDRQIYTVLLPLVDGRPVEEIIHIYFSIFKAEQFNLSNVINYAWSSNVDLERAASAQAKWDLFYLEDMAEEDHRYTEIIKTTILDQISYGIGEAPPYVRDTVFSILFREEGKPVQDNIIERIDRLSKTDLFDTIETRDLATLAGGVQYREFERDKKIYLREDSADCLYYIKKGNVRLETDSRELPRSQGDVFGDESLFGAENYQHEAIAGPVSVYRFTREFLLNSALTSPRIALAFLEKAMVNRRFADPHPRAGELAIVDSET